MNRPTSYPITVLVMIASMSLIPMGDTAAKLMSNVHGVSPLFITWSRFAFGAVILFPLMIKRNIDWEMFLDWRILLRSLLIIGGISSILIALKTETLATSFGAFFVGPILSYFLSSWLLREPITFTRTMLMFLGFLGVLLVVKPGYGFTSGIGFAVLAGVLYGGFLTANRWLNPKFEPLPMLFSQVFIGAIILAPFGLSAPPEITWSVSGLVLASAITSNLANFLLIYAYTRVEASHLAPFVYFQLISATIMGYIIFSDIPDMVTLSGLLLLIASGVASFIMRRV